MKAFRNDFIFMVDDDVVNAFRLSGISPLSHKRCFYTIAAEIKRSLCVLNYRATLNIAFLAKMIVLTYVPPT